MATTDKTKTIEQRRRIRHGYALQTLLKIMGEDVDKKAVLPQRRTFGDTERGRAAQSIASPPRSAARRLCERHHEMVGVKKR